MAASTALSTHVVSRPTFLGNAASRVTQRGLREQLPVCRARVFTRFRFVMRASADPSPAAEVAPPPKDPPQAVQPVKASPPVAKKAGFSMTKGQIVRVDKEKYLESVEYYAVDHPIYFKGLDYIYEDRGEILDLRSFEAGEYALVTWAGIPTSPAWLPTSILIKSDRLSYKRT